MKSPSSTITISIVISPMTNTSETTAFGRILTRLPKLEDSLRLSKFVVKKTDCSCDGLICLEHAILMCFVHSVLKIGFITYVDYVYLRNSCKHIANNVDT